jgi:outer membrane lipoprotein SlyB
MLTTRQMALAGLAMVAAVLPAAADARPQLTPAQERKVAAAPPEVRAEYRRCLEGRRKAENRGTLAGAAGGAAVGVAAGESVGEVALMSGVGALAGNLAGKTRRCDQLVRRYGG